MEISGTVKQIVIKAGKRHEAQFEFSLSDADVIQLVGWREKRLVIHLQPEAEQLRMPDGSDRLPFDIPDPEHYLIDANEYPIHVLEEGQLYRQTGWELREVAGVDRDAPLWIAETYDVDDDTATVIRWRTVDADEIVELAAGLQFRTTIEADTPLVEPASEAAGVSA